MTVADQPLSHELRRRYRAPIEQVFEAWTSAERLAQWYAPVPGWIVTGARVDARPGGAYRLSFGPAPEGDLITETGDYLVVEPPERLTWRLRLSGAVTEQATIDVRLVADGAWTEVVVVQSGDSPDSAVEHSVGWRRALDTLAIVLEHQAQHR